jgi:two-component system sensor histidine kinase PilS (NtrC family)
MPSEHKIAPCPFSKNYLIDENQAWSSLLIYFLYRLMVGCGLVLLLFFGALPTAIAEYSPSLYAIASGAYLLSVVAAAPPLLMRRPAFGLQAQFQVLVDIALIPLVMFASGGIASGIGVLLGLSVAAGGILVGGRCALLFAALASLAVLAEEIYADMAGLSSGTNYPYAGMLGASFFGVAVLAMVLARRAEQSEAIAAQRGVDVENLEQVNEFIIRNLQSGILVIDEHHRVRLSNDSADRLFPLPPSRQALESFCPFLARHFLDWLEDPARDSATLRFEDGPQVHARFAQLGQITPPVYMIFLEDSALRNARFQQSKLASLGRLTASIAHEIRNPLSAINHASQLLEECPNLGEKDRRLIQIIIEHAARLNSVIENVLQISRRGEARRETLDLVPALTKLLADFQARHGLGEAVFRLECKADPPRVSVDPTHFKQIVENLCSNAVKYGNPELGPVLLRVTRINGEPCVLVLDHAPAIDPATVQHLFEPFFTTSSTGTGLGLYIARELAELNQARLEYAAVPGERSCFRLYLADADKPSVAL